METVTITMKNPPALYLEADNVSPDGFAGKTAAQIAELHVHEGNTTSTLGKYFEVSGNAGATAADTKIIVKGDVKKVKYLGMKMSAGEIVVEGSTDQYAGAWMNGGKMLVKGNVEAFAATAMKGGELTIEGNAGNYLGAAYRGDWRGMSGGKILVKGNAGSDIGMYMTGGEMVINGNADVHVMTHAEGGKVIIKGNAKSKVGGQMVEGTIYHLWHHRHHDARLQTRTAKSSSKSTVSRQNLPTTSVTWASATRRRKDRSCTATCTRKSDLLFEEKRTANQSGYLQAKSSTPHFLYRAHKKI